MHEEHQDYGTSLLGAMLSGNQSGSNERDNVSFLFVFIEHVSSTDFAKGVNGTVRLRNEVAFSPMRDNPLSSEVTERRLSGE